MERSRPLHIPLHLMVLAGFTCQNSQIPFKCLYECHCWLRSRGQRHLRRRAPAGHSGRRRGCGHRARARFGQWAHRQLPAPLPHGRALAILTERATTWDSRGERETGSLRKPEFQVRVSSGAGLTPPQSGTTKLAVYDPPSTDWNRWGCIRTPRLIATTPRLPGGSPVNSYRPRESVTV